MHTSQRQMAVGRPNDLSIPRQIVGRSSRSLSIACMIVVFSMVGSATFAEQGMLQTIREDVRGGNSPAPSSPADNTTDNNSDGGYEPSGWIDDNQNTSNCDSSPRANTSGGPTDIYLASALGAAESDRETPPGRFRPTPGSAVPSSRRRSRRAECVGWRRSSQIVEGNHGRPFAGSELLQRSGPN